MTLYLKIAKFASITLIEHTSTIQGSTNTVEREAVTVFLARYISSADFSVARFIQLHFMLPRVAPTFELL